MGKVTADALVAIGGRLREALAALISEDGALPRPTELSRAWKLDQTLCVRTCNALRNEDPLRVLHQLPSTGSLRSILVASRRREVPETAQEEAGAAIAELEEAIAALDGKKANLDTLIGSRLLETRAKIEATSKQSIFRGMSNLLGIQSDVALTSYFVVPSEDDEEVCDEIAIYGSSGLQRLRPELPMLLGGRILLGESGEDVSRAEEVLHGGSIDPSGHSVAIKSCSTDPFPDVDIVRSGRKLLYTIPGDPSGETEVLDLFFASVDRHASARSRRDGHREAPFVFVPRNPVKEMLLDVFVQTSVWDGCTPRLEIGRSEDAILAPEGSDPHRVIDRLDFCEEIRSLGTGLGAVPIPSLPVYPTMLERVCDHRGLDPDVFRLFRLHVRYPVVGYWYSMIVDLPA